MTRNEVMQAILDGTTIYYNDKSIEVEEIYKDSVWIKGPGQVSMLNLTTKGPDTRKLIRLASPVGLMYSLLLTEDGFKIVYANSTLDEIDPVTVGAQEEYNSLAGWGNQRLLKLAIDGLVETIRELSK